MILSSRVNGKFLRYQYWEQWNGMWRGVFDATREEAASDPKCQFVVHNRGIGYELISKLNERDMFAVFRYEGHNRITIQTNGDEKERVVNAIRFKPMRLEGTGAQLPDGNFSFTTALFAYLDNPGEQEKRKQCIDWVNDCFVNPFGGYGNLLVGEFLMGTGGDSRSKNNLLTDNMWMFQMETLFAPDARKWNEKPENRILCCRGQAGDRTKSSCSDGTVNWAENRSACDAFVNTYCHESSEGKGQSICRCFALQDLINDDSDLWGLSNDIPVGCASSCQDALAYKTETMKSATNPEACKVGANVIKNSASNKWNSEFKQWGDMTKPAVAPLPPVIEPSKPETDKSDTTKSDDTSTSDTTTSSSSSTTSKTIGLVVLAIVVVIAIGVFLSRKNTTSSR